MYHFVSELCRFVEKYTSNGVIYFATEGYVYCVLNNSFRIRERILVSLFDITNWWMNVNQ